MAREWMGGRHGRNDARETKTLRFWLRASSPNLCLGMRAAELARLGRRRWLRTPQGAIRAALIEALDLVPDLLKDFASNNLLDALPGGKIRMESLSQVAFQPCVS